MLLSEELLKEYVELFRGKSETELDELAKSFLLCMFRFRCDHMRRLTCLANCDQRDRLCQMLAEDAKRPAFE